MSCGFEGCDIRTMVTFGQGEDATPWVEESSPADVTRFVLFPAAEYGQVTTLKKFIEKGDLQLLDNNQGYVGWNLYHYAVKGYQMNCNYLVSQDGLLDANRALPATLEDARKTQLDIIHALAEGGALPFNRNERERPGDHSSHPPHPSKLALDRDYNFLEAAYLIDILAILHSDPNITISTPGLDLIKVSNNRNYRIALYHLMEWSYYRDYLNVLGYCHDRYMSICHEALRLQPGNIPMFLHAISSSKLDVVQLVFDHEEKRPVPDRLMSRFYQIGREDPSRKANAVSIACDMSLSGDLHIMDNLIHHKVIGHNLINISLSELGLEAVPLTLFHETLNSLSLSSNKLTQLPSVHEWKCKNMLFLNLEDNLLQELPPALFTLPKLSTLNAGHNQIAHVEGSVWTAPSLKMLHLNKNCLTSLPCPELPQVEINHVDGKFRNPREPAVKKAYQVFGIGHEFVNRGVQRDDDHLGGGYNLHLLDLSDNRLVELPRGLPCLVPNLRTLKMSRNNISDLGSVSDYPASLKSLELIGNKAQFCIGTSTVSTSISHCLQSDVKNSVNCSHRTHASLSQLHHLNLSKNNLEGLVLEVTGPVKPPSYPGPPLPLMIPLFPNLQSLSFGHNHLTAVPDGIHRLKNLRNLDISMNKGITHLPLKIYQLKELVGFQYKGIQDPIIHQLENCKDIGHTLHYLRARETDAVPNLCMRLNIIGHFKKGKSTILRTIEKYGNKKGETFLAYTPSGSDLEETSTTFGMESKTWLCTRRKLSSGQCISFCTWEFGGQDEFYPVHQCFLTNRALYLLVWKVTDRDSGIKGLGILLRNLQSKAPFSSVIIVGTHVDSIPKAERENVLRSCKQMIINEYGEPTDKAFPKIRRIHFVGPSDPGISWFNTNKYEELVDIIFEEAMMMEIPKTRDMPAGFHMKILEELIPKSYIKLENVVQALRNQEGKNIMKRSEFCGLSVVKRIIDDPSEVDTAMDTLHNRGSVLHFHMTVLEDYYILNPQWWFDVCALVVSPDNVTDLIAVGDPTSGLLSYDSMVHLFRKKGIEEHTSLVIQFLHQNEVILPIDRGTALAPSLICPIPMVKLFNDPGMFPWGSFSIDDARTTHYAFQQFIPVAAQKSLASDVKIKRTGLILRRMFLLPPIGAGFWSRVISLCLQKDDFPNIVLESFDSSGHLISGEHGLFYQIGRSLHMKWKYWRSGIVLYLNDQIVLSINSLKSDKFTDPTEQSVISETSQKAERFSLYGEEDGLVPLGGTFSEIIEVILPEIHLESGEARFCTVSPKLLAKALEIIDEILKGFCSELSDDGIYTINQMCHVIPCPLCFGDRDNRPRQPPSHRAMITQTRTRVGSAARRFATTKRQTGLSRPLSLEIDRSKHSIVVFSIDQCIEVGRSGSEYIQCPEHENIKLDHLVPDINFNDLSNMKLNVSSLVNPPGSDGTPVGHGCFGVVYHKLLQLTDACDDIHVAVKEFIVEDMVDYNEEMEYVKKYADMRYEINKLSMLKHDYVVKFVGLVTRPPSFVLEWAPLMSLEKIRQNHERQRRPICPVSLYIAMLQVLDGLHYLHAPPIGIIHSDLKLSNILAFRFPDVFHICCNNAEDRGRCEVAMPELDQCGVLMKLGDMGVCVNPAGHGAEDNLGVKRFAPECNNMREKKLTEKVDIFCLAICLYELLTLKGLPPEDFSELEYRTRLANGWRPLFHSKDTNYPLSLSLLLEQCWLQDYNMRPSALVLRDFLEGVTGLSVKKNFEVEVGEEHLNHCLDGYMLVSNNQKVTAFHVVPDHQPLLVYLGIQEDGENKVLALEATEDDETNKTFFQTTVIHQSAEEVVTAICVTPTLDVMLGYQDGKVIYIKAKGGFPQTTSGLHCNKDFGHGKVNFIDYVQEGDLVITGFTNGVAHVMKVQAEKFSEMFLKGFYCCQKENSELGSSGCYVVANRVIPNQLDIWCGCDNSQIEIWSFPLLEIPKWRQNLVNRTTDQISLRNPSYTPHSSAIVNMSLTPDRSSVFALIGDGFTRNVVAICQINTSNKQPLRHWQCQIEQVSYFSVTATDLLVGTALGSSMIFSRSTALEGSTVHPTISVPSHAEKVFQVVVFDGAVTPQGYTSMFHTYLGLQKKHMPCRFIVSLGQGFLNPTQFSKKALKNEDVKRDGYCINVWIV